MRRISGRVASAGKELRYIKQIYVRKSHCSSRCGNSVSDDGGVVR